MADYRCFFLNDRGMIIKADVVTAASDAEAIEEAEALFRTQGTRYGSFELWLRERIVHKSSSGG